MSSPEWFHITQEDVLADVVWPSGGGAARKSARTRVTRSIGMIQRMWLQRWERRLVQCSKGQVMQNEGMIANTCIFVDVVPFVMLRHLQCCHILNAVTFSM